MKDTKGTTAIKLSVKIIALQQECLGLRVYANALTMLYEDRTLLGLVNPAMQKQESQLQIAASLLWL